MRRSPQERYEDTVPYHEPAAKAPFAVDEILALAGTDRMTIPPPLLELLASSEALVPRKLEPKQAAAACADAELVYDESSFRLAMNADVAATTKLAEGMNAFIGETVKLQAAIEAKV